MLQIIIKLILIVLFLLCLFQMPYGYYQVVRFAGMLGFALLAYLSFVQNQTKEVIVYIALGLLFQPFFKLALGRTIWNIVDVIVAIGLILSLIIMQKKHSMKEKS